MARFIAVIGLCFWVGGVFAESPQPAPLQLMSAMKQAMVALNYKGTVAILKNDKLDTLKYFHAVNDGVEQERMLSLNTPLREIVRDNDKVSCLFKASQQVVVDHKTVGQSFLVDLPEDFTKLEDYYQAVNEGEAQVALQDAYVVLLKPRDQFRHTRKFWIAQQSHLPLKVEVQDFTGETLEQVIFTDLNVLESLAAVDVSKAAKDIHHIHQFENLGLDQLSAQINQLPTGFTKRIFTRIHLEPSNKAVERLLLSDGLSSVSVYIEKNAENFRAGLQRTGAVNSLSRVIGDYSVTVMGDVPVAALTFIARGITFTDHTD